MTPRFIYFDMGNVIVTFDRERAVRNVAAVCGGPPDRVREALAADSLSGALERGEIDWNAFHAEFSRQTGTRSDPTELAEAYSDMFELSFGMLPVLAGLERAGCRRGILSNTCGVHWEHLLSRGFGVLPDAFEILAFSHEIGAVKPDLAIFHRAQALAGVEPSAIFFTDDLPEHVEAARRAGWDAELFTGPLPLARSLEARGIDLGL
jgi:FMN phosphatase YigB (HAD superfamily)